MIEKVINLELLRPVNFILILLIVMMGGLALSLLFPPATSAEG